MIADWCTNVACRWVWCGLWPFVEFYSLLHGIYSLRHGVDYTYIPWPFAYYAYVPRQLTGDFELAVVVFLTRAPTGIWATLEPTEG